MSIPLTFDWLTLAWLKVRLHLWWRRARVSPRHFACLLLLGLVAGCVPVTRFEEVQSAAQVEMEGRRRSEYQVAQLKAENAQLRAQMQQQGQALDDREQALSQAELEGSMQGKQRQDAEGIVEQLRGELARVGGHLQAFHEDKQKLELALDAEAARGRELARLSRDAALALRDPLAIGDYSLDAERDEIVLRVPREKVLAEDGSLKADAATLLKAVAKLAALHPRAKLRVEDASAPADPLATRALVTALGELGTASDRFQSPARDGDGKPDAATVGAAAPAATAPSVPEITFALSVP